MPGEGGVDAVDAVLDRDHAVGDGEGEVLVGVDADLGGRVEDVAVGTGSFGDTVHRQPAAGVGDVDAVGAVGLHQLGLLGEFGGGRHVGEHQEARDVHADLAGHRDVLGGDVGLGAVGGDPDRADPQGVRRLQVVHRADTGQQQRRQAGVREDRGGGSIHSQSLLDPARS